MKKKGTVDKDIKKLNRVRPDPSKTAVLEDIFANQYYKNGITTNN